MRFLILLLLLSSCSNFSFMQENEPNEYLVKTNQPLSIPPNFNLRPPLDNETSNVVTDSKIDNDVLDIISGGKKQEVKETQQEVKGIIDNTPKKPVEKKRTSDEYLRQYLDL